MKGKTGEKGQGRKKGGAQGREKGGVQAKPHKGLHIVFGALTAIAAAIAAAGLLVVLLYKAGQAKLMQSVEAKAPDAQMMADASEELAAREKAQLNAVEWQDNWVAIDGKVYAYDEGCVNLLFLGVDKPGDISAEADYENWEAGQTDAIFVMSLNPSSGSVYIVGIPRNSMVNVDIYDGEDHKIDTVFDQICLQYAFAGGGQAGLDRVKESVSGLFYGLPIHGAVAVGYGAVGEINDMVGGVDVEVLEDLTSQAPELALGEKVHLDGDLALLYVRSRNYGQLGSPTLRLKRQKQYVTALAGKVRSAVKENPMAVKDIYNAALPYMNTDVTLEEALYLAAQAQGYSFGEDSFYLLEGEDEAVAIPEEKLRPGEEAEPFYDDYYLDEESVKAVMLDVFYKEVSIGE